MPVAACRALGIFCRALFEEVRVLNTVQDFSQPRDRVLGDAENRLQLQLSQTPIGDVANVLLDVVRGHALNRAHFEGKLNELVFQ